MREIVTSLAARAALLGSSLAGGNLFWVRAALGRNALHLHDCTPDGAITIGGVSEQLYGEGFLTAWHEVLGAELGPRLAPVLYEVGRRGGLWECGEAIRRGVWVPALLRPLVGKRELLDRIRASAPTRAVMTEALRILFRMILSEGGWGVVTEIDLGRDPMHFVLENGPEPRRLGRTGRCSCLLSAGIAAGYFEAIFATPATVTETACRSRGDAACTFAVAVRPG
jgi:predicted hydrocarbon binding protein